MKIFTAPYTSPNEVLLVLSSGELAFIISGLASEYGYRYSELTEDERLEIQGNINQLENAMEEVKE